MKRGGADRSENVGMSNYLAGENPARRIPKVSHATVIGVGLVGPKARPNGVADGQQVNIPALHGDRQGVEVESLLVLYSAPPCASRTEIPKQQISSSNILEFVSWILEFPRLSVWWCGACLVERMLSL